MRIGEGGKVLLLAACTSVLAICMFCRGFLLVRQTFDKHSMCLNGDKSDVCMLPRRFDRAIVLIIDALRYDFVQWHTDVDEQRPYHNRLSVIGELQATHPHDVLVSQFIADPPTTTLQRIKALTTGSLPTFIDAGSNFAAESIDEDNWLHQINARARRQGVADNRVLLLGDDTWQSCYANELTPGSRAYPSFDVHDLHTVDNGIIAQLPEALRKDDWTVMIAHFLGVDHAGHKHGSNHPAMQDKLDQMNEVLRNVTRSLPKDTVLFIMGDHGMTESGDHGGDSTDEVNSALVVYAPGLNIAKSKPTTIPQIDVVPTLSLLLDIPIPYSSLGAPIGALFQDNQTRAYQLALSQISTYAESYLAVSSDDTLHRRLRPLLELAKTTFDADEAADVIRRIQTVFREVWAQFHLGWMVLGLLSLAESITYLLGAIIATNQSTRVSFSTNRAVLRVFVIVGQLYALLGENELVPELVGFILITVLIWDAGTIVVMPLLFHVLPMLTDGAISRTHVVLWTVCIVQAASLLSNSYIVNENVVARACMCTGVVLLWLRACAAQVQQASKHWRSDAYCDVLLREDEDSDEIMTAIDKGAAARNAALKRSRIARARAPGRRLRDVLTGIAVIALLIINFTSGAFVRCREEIADCINSNTTLPRTAFASVDEQLGSRFVYCAAYVLLTCFALLYYLRQNGNLNPDTSLAQLFVHHTVIFMSVCIVLHFAIALFVENPPHSVHLVLGQIAVAPIALAVFSIVCPQTHMSVRNRGTRLQELRDRIDKEFELYGEKVRQQQYKLALEELDASGNVTYLCGRQLCYTAPLLVTLFSATCIVALLVGDGVVGSLGAQCVLLIAVAHLVAEGAEGMEPLTVAPVLSLMTLHGFYALGRQPVFAAIPWHAAFALLPGNFPWQFMFGGAIVIAIYAMHIVLMFALPLASVWKYYVRLPSFARTKQKRAPGEQVLMTSSDSFVESHSAYAVAVYLTFALRLGAAMLAAYIHRRHLMVWKIFAPRFIFEGIGFLVSTAALIIVLLICARIDSKLKSVTL